MITSIKWSLLLTGMALATTCSAESLQVTFDDLERLVRERNLHTKGSELLSAAAEAGRGHLERSYLPRLSAQLGQEGYKTGDQDSRDDTVAGTELVWNIYQGGRDTAEDKIRETHAKVAKLDSEQVLRFELGKARSAYWRLVAQREIKGILDRACSENLTQISSAKQRVEAGLATKTDILEFEMNQIRLEQERTRNRLEIKKHELELITLLGFEQQQTIDTPIKVLHLHQDQILDDDFDPHAHPSVASLQSQGVEAQLAADKAKRWWIPALDIHASYNLHPYREREYDRQSERREGLVGARLSMQLFDGLEQRTESRQRQLEAAGRRAESEQTAAELLAEVENARHELRAAHDIIHTSEKGLTIAKSYLSETLDEYSKGVKNSPDVLSALEKNLELHLRFVELKLDHQLARTRLLALLGR